MGQQGQLSCRIACHTGFGSHATRRRRFPRYGPGMVKIISLPREVKVGNRRQINGAWREGNGCTTAQCA